MILLGGMNAGSHPVPDSVERISAYADTQAVASMSVDVDWQDAEFERIAEQTLGGSISA